jgi:hypothetical protein
MSRLLLIALILLHATSPSARVLVIGIDGESGVGDHRRHQIVELVGQHGRRRSQAGQLPRLTKLLAHCG